MISDARIVANFLTDNQYDWIRDEKDSYTVSYTNNSSVGNRYIRWNGLWAYKSVNDDTPDGTRLEAEAANSRIRELDWRNIFALIEYGVVVGPSILATIQRCAQSINDTQLPEESDEKVRTWNGMVHVYVSERTSALWKIQADIRKEIAAAFWEDRENKQLLSDDWIYMEHSFSGWNRST